MKQKILGADLKVGDVLDTWCGAKTITSFDEHPGLHAWGEFYTARIAVSGDWAMTVFDEDHISIY